MPNVIESFRSARRRINPEGLVFSASVTAASTAILPAFSAGVTYAVHELAKETDPTLIKILAIGILGILNGASVTVETKALRSKEYSASPVSSTLYVLTGKPLLSSLGGHAINYAQISVLNPINIFSVATKNNELLVESEGSAAFILTIWLASLNTLVLKGKTQPFVNGVKKVRQVIGEKIHFPRLNKHKNLL